MKKINRKPDFSGIATKANEKCSDGRVISPKAFAHNNESKVPIVWEHGHSSPDNVLGYGILRHQANGDVRVDGFFNETENGKLAKTLVQSANIDSLSIFATQIKEENLLVKHGNIREVSLVISGANPGAKIDFIEFAHGDISESEAIIHSGVLIDRDDNEPDDEDKKDNNNLAHANKSRTIKEVFDDMDDDEKSVVYAMMDVAVEASISENEEDISQSEDKGEEGKMKKNAFSDKEELNKDIKVLSHSEINEVLNASSKNKSSSLKQDILAHTQDYGIENIDYLFPDAKTIRTMPDEILRDQGWVTHFYGKSHHSPFSRIKSTSVDLTIEEARALGYVKGSLKKEDYVTINKRVTTPTTVYIKRKLDRDDIIDIVDFDVVLWQKGHMRLALNEEVARAALIGDGRDAEHADKIKEDNIRPVYKDDVFYAPRTVLASDKTTLDIMDEIVKAQVNYKGTRSPVFYTTTLFYLTMLLVRDENNRRLYNSKADVAAALNVSDIVEVPVMDNVSRNITSPAPATINLLGIILNPVDYTFGADRGGSINTFDDFDIDYNQQKFLMETRLSGALTRPSSAMIIEQTAAG